jgi:hypothetical protein
MMTGFVCGVAVWFFGFGLWEHDWRILLCSALVAFCWPLLEADVYSDRRHRQLLDRLWDDDDDLSSSA